MRKGLLDRTFVRFLMVGVVNTLFGSAVMFGCYNLLHLDYWVSTAANYVFGSILSYVLNRYFTFRSKAKGLGSLWRFVVNILVCYLVAYGIAKPLVRLALAQRGTAVQENAAMLVGMVLFTLLNYVGQRFFAFRERK